MLKNQRRKKLADILAHFHDAIEEPDFDLDVYRDIVNNVLAEMAKGALNHELYLQTVGFGKSILNDPEIETYGIKVKDKAIFISLIINILERIPIPSEVLERHPDLTVIEWQATMRVATLILAAFEADKRLY
jgi:hypothetical protein